MTTMSATIDRARPDEIPRVLRLLEQQGLPLDGARELGEGLLVARQDGQVVGAAGLEFYVDGALLRSVVVEAGIQGQRLGQRLTEAALALASERCAPAVFLLTTTAERFFLRFGFERIDRNDVPASVRGSVEFTSACPASAVVMRRRIDAIP